MPAGDAHKRAGKVAPAAGYTDIVLGEQSHNTLATLVPAASLAFNGATCLACAFAPPCVIGPLLGYYK